LPQVLLDEDDTPPDSDGGDVRLDVALEVRSATTAVVRGLIDGEKVMIAPGALGRGDRRGRELERGLLAAVAHAQSRARRPAK
jgi:hypothetical protein